MSTAEQDEDLDQDMPNLDLGELDITSVEDDILDVSEAAGHIQANLDDERVQEALKKGVDLRQYAKQMEDELQKVENASIGDYIKASESIASLHYQIHSCDGILERMEQMLSSFQADLGSISSEIQSLQEQSLSMNVQLKNRQSVRSEISQFVDDMFVNDTLVKVMCDVSASEQQFVEQLHELDHKINFLKEQDFREAMSVNDVHDIVDKLKIKAVTKIREFLKVKISGFRRPMANYQVMQNTLLNFRYYYEFLMAHHRDTAHEIRTDYVDTMGKIYFSYFKTYYSRLMKLQFDEVASKDDLMGVEDTAKRGFFNAASRVAVRNRTGVFTLGDRACILTTELEDPAIIPHSAQKVEKKYSFEGLFRSLHYALLDNVSREYLFVVDFFSLSGENAQLVFNAIMGKALTYLLRNLEAYIEGSFDAISIFLCIHVLYRYEGILKRRNVPSLASYIQRLQNQLWPRFETIVELNLSSIRDCEPSKLGHIDIRPHYITRRYAEFSAAIVGINESQPQHKVLDLLGRLQQEVENFILRMAAEFPGRKEQLVFLINNYDMMLAVLTERTSDDSKESESFQQLLNARTGEFVEEALAPGFGGLMTFVKDTEPLVERGQAGRVKVDQGRLQQIVRGFSNDWKRNIDAINQDVMRSFSNFKNGQAILQAVLTQLIQYYHRFTKILSQPPFATMAGLRSQLVNIHHVMVEVKKHRTQF
ncbi:vacuolar protein sorting-associated protein 52 homolog [Sycon ciliatum]|uniref:vacuolar protein sorting-associated protein 52 homolog n=1 Tax=Sycon ciliatum TaxID=27933 RepID=UPI0031F6E88E